MGILARAVRKAFDQGVGTIGAGAHIAQGVNGGTAMLSFPRNSVTGIRVTTDRALSYSAFWAGVRVLSETYAQVELQVMRRLPDGGSEPAYSHPLYPVLHDAPNPRMTSFQWRETQMGHKCTWGNAYNVKARDGNGRIRELWPLAPERMSVRAGETGEAVYNYVTAAGQTKELTRADILHIPALAWDGLVGLSPIAYHKEAIGLGLATEEHGGRFFSQGASTNFVLSTDGKLSDTAFDHLHDQIKTEKVGLGNAWDPWILEEGLHPITLSVPNDSAQWLETRKHQVHEVARVLNLHPYKLGVAEPGAISYKSVEQFATDFVTNTMMPWFVRGEQAMSQQLLDTDWTGMGGDYYVSFRVASLMRGDMAERFAAYAVAINTGFMPPNEARVNEGWNRIPGLDAPLRPLNVTTVAPDGSSTRTEFVPPSDGLAPPAV